MDWNTFKIGDCYALAVSLHYLINSEGDPDSILHIDTWTKWWLKIEIGRDFVMICLSGVFSYTIPFLPMDVTSNNFFLQERVQI